MIDAEAVRKLFDENIDDHRKYYKLGFEYWHRGEGSTLPASLSAVPKILQDLAELGYQDAAKGRKPPFKIDLPKKYFEEPTPQQPPAPSPVTPASSGSAPTPASTPNTTPKPKDAEVPKPKAEEEFLPPTDQAKYWYLRGFEGDSVKPPAEFLKWYRSGLKDRESRLPARVVAPTPQTVPPAPGGSDLTMPLLGLGGLLALGLGLSLMKRRKRSRS